MIFIDPSVEEVYKTILNNNEIIDFLKKEKIIVTEKEIRINYTEKKANSILPYIFANNVSTIYNIAEILVKYKEELKNLSVAEALSIKGLKKDLSDAVGISYEYLKDDVYRYIIYTYKYCYVSSFFQNNKSTFLPDNDFFELENNPMAMSFYDAILKEFDKLDSTLDQCTEYLDFDKIPWDLMNYVTQILGFEKSSFRFEDEDEKRIRSLVKSILDLYRIKGTNYSFELLFSLLGYDIKISEYYFDRRLFYLRSGSNPETDEIDRREYEFYLTTSNPEKNNTDASINEIIMPSDISEQYSLKEFNELANEYGPDVVLGYSSHYKDKDGKYKKYEGKIYKYFKTNLVYYDITLPGKNIPARKYITIGKCLNFLTPSYVTRRSSIARGNDFDFKDTLSFNGSNEIEILDGEDFSDYGSEALTKGEDGKFYNSDGTLYQNSLKKEVASDERKAAANKYKTPIDYKFLNLSLNKYLTKGTGSEYLTEKRIKYYMVKKNTRNAMLYPYYTVPPKVDDEDRITLRWESQSDQINLIGKDSIKSKLITKGSKIEIDSLENIGMFDELERTELFSARDLVPIFIIRRNNGKDIPSIEDIKHLPFSFSSEIFYEKEKLDKYYNYKNICEKLVYGKCVIGYDENKIYIYRYGNYKIPSKTNGLYDHLERRKYLESFLYEPVCISNENDKEIKNLLSPNSYNNLEEIREKINKERIIQIENDLIDLNSVTNSVYYNLEDKKYYKPIRIINPNNIKFPKNEDAFLNKEFEEGGKAYIYRYKNRKVNKIYYSKLEEKFYKINSNLEYEELVDFYGRIEKENGKYYLYQYDKDWDGYDEEADNEDFIGYNSDHIIYWPKLELEDKKIGRPIKFLLNKDVTDISGPKDDELFDEIYDLSFGNISKNDLNILLKKVNLIIKEDLEINEMYFDYYNFLIDYQIVFNNIMMPTVLPDALELVLKTKGPIPIQDCYKKALTECKLILDNIINKEIIDKMKQRKNNDYNYLDEYGRFLNSYHFTKYFAESILQNDGYLTYLIDYYYKKLTSLYRYRLLDDNNKLNIDRKESIPMFAVPGLRNSLYTSWKDSLLMQNMLRTSHRGFGTSKEPIKVKFEKSKAYVSDKKLYINMFKKDIFKELGIFIDEIKLNVDIVRPVFFCDSENNFFRKYRSRMSKIYKKCKYNISKEMITIILDLDFYIPDDLMIDIYGYVEFRNFKQSLLDTTISVPESYREYLNKDSYGRINQFTSFGDDREFNYSIIFPKPNPEETREQKGLKCSAFINDKGKIVIKVPKDETTVSKINSDVRSVIVEDTTAIK